MFKNRKLFEKNVELLAETNVLSDRIDFVDKRSAHNFSISFARLDHAGKHTDGSRLSCAVMAQKSENFVFVDVEVE